MQKSVLILCGLLSILLTGCGPHYFRPALGIDQPAEITVSAYTQDGCLENLEEEAKKRQVEIKQKKLKQNWVGKYYCSPTTKVIAVLG
ncbi:MAG: hypothetical protein IPN42_02250 [Methylococcaceae bacterium]|nr:hypothetical protein [Methylococcaceae bacterium]